LLSNLVMLRIQESPFDNIIQSKAMGAPLELDGGGKLHSDGRLSERNGKRGVRDANVLSFGCDEDDDDTDDDKEDEGKEGQHAVGQPKETVSISGESSGTRKRARFSLKSSHDVLVGDPVLQRTTNKFEASADVKNSELPAPEGRGGSSEAANFKSKIAKRSASEILAEAEREYQQLRAEAVKNVSPSSEATSVEPLSKPVLPSKYATLQRGVKSGKAVGGKRRHELESTAARLKELRLRVQAGADAGLAKHLVFRQSADADTSTEHDYATIDPLDGIRGRSTRQSERPERTKRRE
jgi:hypothetical protein